MAWWDRWWDQRLLERKYLKERTLEGLFRCPFFFGELTRENAIEILNEAVKLDGESEYKSILFLETVSDDIGQNRFALVRVTRDTVQISTRRGPYDIIQPEIYFREIDDLWSWNWTVHSTIDQFCTWSTTEEYQDWRWNIVRKKPFSLEVLAAVKAATCGFNLETLKLPRMINEQVKKLMSTRPLNKVYLETKLLRNSAIS